MVFLGKQRYEVDSNIFKTLKELANGMQYQDYLFLTDTAEDAATALLSIHH